MQVLLLFIMLLLSPVLTFANTPIVPLEAYGKLPSKSMLVISPNAKRMAFRDTSNGRDVMVVIDLVKNKRLTEIDISAVKPNNVYFIDNDRLIFVMSQHRGILGFSGKADMSAAYIYSISSNNIRQLLIAGYGIYKGQTQLGRLVGISQDKKFAFMLAYGNSTTINLYKVDLRKKRKPRIYRKGTPDTIDFFVNTKGAVIARERYSNQKDLHRVEALINGEWQEIFREKTAIRTKGFSGVTSDGKSLVMISKDKQHGRWAYYTLSLSNGKVAGPVFSRQDKDIEVLLKDIQRVVQGVRYSGFTSSYEFFDEKLNARMRGINKAMPSNTFNIIDYTPNFNSMVLYMDGELSAGDYVLYQNGGLSLLTSARPDIPPQAVHPVKEYSFNARDGLSIPSLITTPKNQTANNLPAIMLPHGGPESYDRIGFNWKAQYFASQGYVVIQPQYRGSKGFGPDHLLAGRGEWGRKMQDDLTDAVNDLATKGVIDKNRVCIVGGSYGGYAALAGATFTPNLYQCVVAINGVFDVEQMLDTEEYNHGSDHWVVSYWQNVISEGDVNDEHLAQISPINFVNKVKAPVLLIHGTLDQSVPFEQSENMFDKLEGANKNVTFIELEGGDHYLSNGENRMKALKAIDKFIKQFI